jgi:UDP-glucose 4-epimerase
MIRDKTILVTGGCGFVAGRIAEIMGEHNRVDVVDNMRYWKEIKGVEPKGCKIIKKNIDASIPLDHYDYIIHGATVNIIHAMSDMRACVDTNFTQTLAFFDRIPKEIPILYLSTASVYGNGIMFPTSEVCRVAPSNAYAMTKLLAEQYLLDHHPRAVVARLSNVYGPRQRPENAYSGVMVKMLISAIKGSPFTVYGDGVQTRDFTYVDDVVDACSILLEKGKEGQVYNVGTGVETSVAQLLRYLHRDTEIEHVKGRSIDNIFRRCLDIRKIGMDTGWKPRVSLDQGIALTKEWLEGVI